MVLLIIYDFLVEFYKTLHESSIKYNFITFTSEDVTTDYKLVICLALSPLLCQMDTNLHFYLRFLETVCDILFTISNLLPELNPV